jgi:DNA-binding response OmpR family regulator
MDKPKILWADDEIDLLRPHILFLNEKGYEVITATNGNDAIDLISRQHFDIVFLDEHMPGPSGLQTLSRIKTHAPEVPVVMVTKSEDEGIMDEAIGSKIADYLIKPVKPHQLLLALKKNLEKQRLVDEKTSLNYQQEFRHIGSLLNEKLNAADWIDIYRKLVYWELELENLQDRSIYEVLTLQKDEARLQFSRFVEKHYLQWLHRPDEHTPLLSPQLFKKKVFPVMEATPHPVFFILIDNLRLDQWKVIYPFLSELYTPEEDSCYYSILPTATQYARNALFAGLMPSEIEKLYPDKWIYEDEEEGKNLYEEFFVAEQLKRFGKTLTFRYFKITDNIRGKELADSVNHLFQTKLNVIVYNFVDLLSHARTDMKIIRELAEDEPAYRSLTRSWFAHSPLLEAIRKMSEKPCTLIITTDHGSIRVKTPSKIIGDRQTSTNLRYKQGKNLSYEKKDVMEVRNPADAFLPRPNVSTVYVFIKHDKFFVYPNNYHYYVNHYRNTFQHGGISPEEMIIPFAVMQSKA